MKKRTKLFRMVAVVLTISVLLSTGIAHAFAEDLTSVTVRNSQIVSALRSAENYKGDLGLSDVDFSDITVANPLQTYYYTDSGLDEGIVWYPLKAEGELVAFAIEVAEGKFVIDTDLVEEINKVITDTSSFAIIYDEDSCSLYDGVTLSRLATNAKLATERGDLQAVADLAPYASRIDRTGIAVSSSVGYTPAVARSSTYYGCAVANTPQVYSNLCWAACVAAIANFKRGTSWTAASLAQNYYGSTSPSVFNEKLSNTLLDDVLRSYTSCSYYYYSSFPSSGLITRNVGGGYPMVGAIFLADTGSPGTSVSCEHVVVMRGIETLDNSVSIMDPATGFRTAVPDANTGGYVYYYSGDGYYRRIARSYYVLT